MEKIYKQFIAETKIDEDERTVTAVISTSGIDRDKEVLMPKGAMIDNYMKNRVVLWAHDYGGEPIGKALYIDKKRNEIVAKIKFAETEKAEDIYQLFKGGFLSAFSVGFIPIKSHKPEPKEIAKRPEWSEVWRVIDEWELLEFSAVPVPSNPEALATAVKTKGIEVSEELVNEVLPDYIDEPDYEEEYKDEPLVTCTTTTVTKDEDTTTYKIDVALATPEEVELHQIDLEPITIPLKKTCLSTKKTIDKLKKIPDKRDVTTRSVKKLLGRI